MNTYEKNGADSAGREVTKIQIFRFVAKDKILDITDLLAFDPKRSKVAFSIFTWPCP